MSTTFIPLVDDSPAAVNIVPIKANPWAAAIDGQYRTPPAIDPNHAALGQNLTQHPAYISGNPPPYIRTQSAGFTQYLFS